MKLLVFILSVLSLFITGGSESLWCYSCVSTQPGCGDYLDWRIHHSITCPKDNDKCVKIIERRGAEKLITRECLSNLEGLRKDIPADRFEGCRPAAAQPKLAVYVENTVKQLELKRDYWTNITYCFCDFDQWCNEASLRSGSILSIFFSLFVSYLSVKLL
ncbi:uncharacterized protein LOC111618437 [Centruroides sculpturatus]|uniref:uncharacterized protein LOC111618437 n=1 Tax=Centruroides sculpturatus TaxID=218467 RepID=UPI000C6CF202|nr:uncharacterized protein LOC111618437 [Centruroides sculpturatus]